MTHELVLRLMSENEISRVVVDCAFKIHNQYGAGLLESVYERILSYELERAGLPLKRQIPIPVIHRDVHLDIGFRLDILVMEKVIIEIKSVEELTPLHSKQLLTYLRLTNLRLGLLINFNVNLIKDGIRRVV